MSKTLREMFDELIMAVPFTNAEARYIPKIKVALEKQIPKKATHEATKIECCTCPDCKNVIDEFETFWGQKIRVCVQFCKYCGQALDWGDCE